jgi:aldehyde dehydrogenase (NAD+)
MISDDPSVIQPALDHLRQTFLTGRTRPLKYRKQQLKNLIRGLQELEPKFHAALQKDLNANEMMSYMLSTNLTIEDIKHTLSNIDSWSKPKSVDTPLVIGPGRSYIQPEPYGVALIVGPWNYPVSTCVPYLATAIASGNCCIVKPSEMSAHTSNVIAELVDKYLDKDCYRCIEGQVEVAKAIIKEKFDLIVFTGSTEKGKLVAKAAAENLIPCVLELGGKSPTIVDRDADLDNAALRIVQGRMINCGQTCIACDYLFVHKDIKAKLLMKMQETVTAFYSRDPSTSEDYPRMINDFHFQRVKSYLDEDHGGKVVIGGQIKPEEKYIAPTVVDNPRLDSKLMQEEIFGPVLPVLEFADLEYVIKFIQERPKPLALYYYGSTLSNNYKRVKTLTSSGALMANDSVFHFANNHLPFGGVGSAGYGKLHGREGFKSFTHNKSVMEKTGINFFPFDVRYPPYAGSRGKLLKFMLKLTHINQSTIVKTLVWLSILGIGYKMYNRGRAKLAYDFVAIVAKVAKAIAYGDPIPKIPAIPYLEKLKTVVK